MADSFLTVLLHNWPAVLLLAIIAYVASNYFNHGLHKYPGPFLAGLTDWVRFYKVYKRRPDIWHIGLHKKYGDVVRLGPNCLSFADPMALKTIYGLNKGFTKSEFYPVQMAVSNGHRLPSLFSTTSEPFHAQLRRSVNSAFSMSTLIQYEPFVDSTTELFLTQTEKLYAFTGAACDFSRWLQFYAFDVIGEMTYSKRHGFLEENKDIDGIVEYISTLFNYVAPIGQIPTLDLLFLKNPLYLLAAKYGLVDATFAVAKFAKERVAERYSLTSPSSFTNEKPGSKPDLLSKFIAAKTAHPTFFTDQHVTTMAVSMAFAGSETTAISLSAVFYHLLKNPRCMDKVRAEIDGLARQGGFADTQHGVVTFAESQSLNYLDASIKEAFRMHPAAGLPLERVVPEPGVEIAGRWVKGGTIVGVSAWVLHRRTDVFGLDADVYRPERWLVDESLDREAEEKRIKEMGSSMLHFGMGARTCIGKNISLLEIYKLVPTVLRRFEVRLEDPSQEWTLWNAWFVRQLNFRTKFYPREIVLPEEVQA